MPDSIVLSNWPALILGATAIFAGSFVQGSTGLGLGMVAAPILLMIDPVFVPGPLLALALVLSALMAKREWRSVDRKGLTIAISGRIPGTLLAGVTITLIPIAAYGIIFGSLVLLAVLLSVGGWKAEPTGRNLFIAGCASGYMGTLTSIGAPPIALTYQRGEPAELRSTMAAFFVIGTIISLITLAAFGRFSSAQLYASLFFVPPLLFGYWVSGFAVRHVDKRIARLAVLSLSGISALILIIKSLVTGI